MTASEIAKAAHDAYRAHGERCRACVRGLFCQRERELFQNADALGWQAMNATSRVTLEL